MFRPDEVRRNWDEASYIENLRQLITKAGVALPPTFDPERLELNPDDIKFLQDCGIKAD